MTEYTITEWTIDGDEAHAHAIGKKESGEHVEEITLSRAHDAPGWMIEGRDGEVYDTPNQALEQLESESPDDDDEENSAVPAPEPTRRPHTLFQATSDHAHIFPSRWDARTANRLIKYFYPKQYTEIDKLKDHEWIIHLNPIMPATDLAMVKYLSTPDLEELQSRNRAELDAKYGAGVVKEPTRPYGGQSPFLTLTLKNETTGKVWTHPIGQHDASALSEWWTDQSEYQRQDLPYEVEETVSRIVAAYAEHENEDDARILRAATEKEIHAYLMNQSGVISVYADGPFVRCSRLSDSGRGLITWAHSRLDQWTVTIEGGHTWLRGPNNLGWIITNDELSRQGHGIEPQNESGR